MNGTHSTGFFSSFSRQTANYTPNIVDKVETVRVNDYTKNISSSIFTPSLRDPNMVPQHKDQYNSP